MRMDSKISFYSESKRRYNPHASKYEGGTELVATRYGNVTDVGTNRSVELFGKYDQRAKTIRFSEPVTVSWSYLTIDDSPVKYRLNTERRPLKGVSLIVGEG